MISMPLSRGLRPPCSVLIPLVVNLKHRGWRFQGAVLPFVFPFLSFVFFFLVVLFSNITILYITISHITISSTTMVRQGARVGGWVPFFVLSMFIVFLFCFSLIYFRKAVHVVRKHCCFLLVCAFTADGWQKLASQDDDHFPSSIERAFPAWDCRYVVSACVFV